MAKIEELIGEIADPRIRAEIAASGLVLEIGSGTGQHVIHFAKVFPRLTFQPSDPDAAFRRSVAAW